MAKIAVVGVGGWGKNHVRALSELDALSVVCDVDACRVKSFADKYDVNSYTSIDDMLKNEKLDGAIISTPTSTHFAVAKQIMECRINVLVEKPMAPSSAECEQMRSIAKRNHVIITTGYIERFNPAVNQVKNFISQKKYGDVLMLEFHRENRMPVNIRDVGIIYDTSVHDIDTALYLFNDKPHMVFAKAGSVRGAHEDFVAIVLGFENQKIAFIASNWVTPKKVRQFIAVCTDAIITGDFITQEIKIDQGGDTLIPRRELEEPLMLELKNFTGAIDGNVKPLVSEDDAISTTRVAEAALLSSKTGSPIYLDLK
ncbi:MAG: Gfo/Idh/MocA family oxidoreductase [Nitrososphaerales archaeon]